MAFKKIKNNLPVGEEIEVIFDGVYLRNGSGPKGKWTLLEIRFKNTQAEVLNDTNWNPDQLEKIDKIFLNTKLQQLANTLAGEDVWNNNKHNPLEKTSYIKAYSNIIKMVNKYRGEKLLLKTIVRDVDEYGKAETMLPDGELLLLDNNEIFSKVPGELKYNNLEKNNLESYGIEMSTVLGEKTNPIDNSDIKANKTEKPW